MSRKKYVEIGKMSVLDYVKLIVGRKKNAGVVIFFEGVVFGGYLAG
jgi:hypothetical protein